MSGDGESAAAARPAAAAAGETRSEQGRDRKRGAGTRRDASGFDYLRLLLALAVLAFHCVTVTQGASGERDIWTAWWRGGNALVLPMFFAMSGYLLAANLERTSPAEFVIGRILRLGPALALTVLGCALVLGPLVSHLSLAQYVSAPSFWRYLLNLIALPNGGTLPGVFEHNPMPGSVNLPLWTLPYQVMSYGALLAAGYLGLTRRGLHLVAVVIALILTLAVHDWKAGTLGAADEEVPPRLLVLTFLGGACIHALRDRLVITRARAAAALAVSLMVLSVPGMVYLAPLPVALATVHIGSLALPRVWLVRGRDLSYGVYLLAFPLQQTVVMICPWLTAGQMLVLTVPAALALAAACYRWVEKPCMDLGKRLRAPAMTGDHSRRIDAGRPACLPAAREQ